MGEDIPDIVERIASKTATTYSKVADLEGKIRFNRAMINMRQAKRVKNPDGVINYTFDLYPDDAPENAFYTLVVSRAENGTLDEPYVIGYEMTDADFDNFMAHDMDFRYFRAKQKFYNFDSFFTDSKNNRVGKSGDCGSNTIGSGGSSGGGHTAPGETFTHNYNGTMASTTFGTRQNANLYNYNITIDFNGSQSTASTTANSSSLEVLGQMPDGWGTPDPLPMTLYLSTPSSVNVTIGSISGGSPCIKGSTINDASIYTNKSNCPPPHQLKGGTASKGTDCIKVNGGVSISVNLAVKKIDLVLGEEYKLNGKQMIALSEKNDLVIDIYNFLQTNTSEEDKAFVLEAAKAIEKGGSVDIEERLIFDNEIYERLLAAMSPKEREIYDNELNSTQKTLYLTSAVNAYIYAEVFYPNPVRNRIGDAVKHSMWNALSTSRIGGALTKKLTDAHEDIVYDSNYPNHFKETQMDYFNNSVGRSIGRNQSTGIFILIEAAKRDGQLRYLSNLIFKNGFYNATSGSNLIPTN